VTPPGLDLQGRDEVLTLLAHRRGVAVREDHRETVERGLRGRPPALERRRP
jgi:hypothetical protein